MTGDALILLANFLAAAGGDSKATGKKIVMIGSDKKKIKEFIAMSPDLDANLIAVEELTTNNEFCDFFATTGYEKVYVFHHGYDTGLVISEKKGDHLLFTSFSATLKRLEIKSAIREIEFFSCMAGGNAASLMEIAETLGVIKIRAHTYLRARVKWEFKMGINQRVLNNLVLFKDFLVFGEKDNDDIQTLLKNHQNTVTFQCFFPLGPDEFPQGIKNIHLETQTRDEVSDILGSLLLDKVYSIKSAKKVTISGLETAIEKQKDYLKASSIYFDDISFIPFSEPRNTGMGPFP